MTVKAKFLCETIVDTTTAYIKSRKVTFRPVTGGSEENKSFAKYTPSGSLEMVIDSETQAYDAFTPGKEYFLTIESE